MLDYCETSPGVDWSHSEANLRLVVRDSSKLILGNKGVIGALWTFEVDFVGLSGHELESHRVDSAFGDVDRSHEYVTIGGGIGPRENQF